MNKMITTMKRALSILVTLGFTGICSAAEKDCGQQELTRCARPLQILQDTSDLKFVSRKEELDKLCPDLFSGIQCIKSYTRRCFKPTQREHFDKLYRGTGKAVENLCTPGDYQTRFLLHAPCLKELKHDYEKCAGVYQGAVGQLSANISNAEQYDEKMRTVCCSFQEYMSCSERVVRGKCGEDAAAFTREFLHGMADSLITSHCSEFSEGSVQCNERMMELNKSSILQTSLAAILMPVLLALSTILSNNDWFTWYHSTRN